MGTWVIDYRGHGRGGLRQVVGLTAGTFEAKILPNAQ